MALLIEVIQETMTIIDINDAMIPIYTVKAISNSDHSQLVACRETTYETDAQDCSEAISAVVLTDHVLQVILNCRYPSTL